MVRKFNFESLLKEFLEIVDDLEKEENKKIFKLEKGMRVKNIYGTTNIFLELILGEYWYENRTCNLIDEIDWEATRKLNEEKEFPDKKEEYIVLDKNGDLTFKINSIEFAEEHIKNKLEICVDNEFTIYKKIKSAKGTAKVEWDR